MSVEKDSDDLWLGVKVQSNWLISGSPRNSSWASLIKSYTEVKLLNESGGPPDYPIQSNSECRIFHYGSQTVGDKLHSREGNSPDRQLRSRI